MIIYLANPILFEDSKENTTDAFYFLLSRIRVKLSHCFRECFEFAMKLQKQLP